MMPIAIFERDGQNIHNAMIERFARGGGVKLLWIARSCANDIMRVVARMDSDLPDVVPMLYFGAHAKCKVDERLRLVLGRVLLGVSLQYCSMWFPSFRQGHSVLTLGAVEHIG